METGASKAFVIRIGAVCTAIMAVIAVVTFIMNKGEEHREHEYRDSMAAFESHSCFEAREGVSDSLRALIRIVTEKKFNEELR